MPCPSEAGVYVPSKRVEYALAALIVLSTILFILALGWAYLAWNF